MTPIQRIRKALKDYQANPTEETQGRLERMLMLWAPELVDFTEFHMQPGDVNCTVTYAQAAKAADILNTIM